MNNYQKGTYAWFDELVSINNIIIPNNDCNVRQSTIKYISVIDLDFQKFLALSPNNSLQYIELALNLLGIMVMLQYFFDGNKRTALVFFNNYFKNSNINLKLDFEDIPLFYKLDDTCSLKKVMRVREKNSSN